MRMARPPLGCVAALLASLLLACGSSNNARTGAVSPSTSASATKTATASATATTSATVASTGTPSTPGASPAPASPEASPSVGSATPSAAGCLQFSLDPLAEADGTVVPRAAVDGGKWTIPNADVPQGFINQGNGDLKVESISAQSLSIGTADPPASFQHLQQIGMLGGRHQEWAGPVVSGITPVVDILHIVFNDDRGARNFLRNPVVAAVACIKEEPGQNLGQETRHFSYTAPVKLAAGGTTNEEGHSVMWRCGRVVINVVDVGPPGQFTQGKADDLSRKVQALFAKTDPCS